MLSIVLAPGRSVVESPSNLSSISEWKEGLNVHIHSDSGKASDPLFLAKSRMSVAVDSSYVDFALKLGG